MRKNPDSKEWGLQAGALVLASGGTCLIGKLKSKQNLVSLLNFITDEFDKMDETDMGALHEAMERQTITISKASVHSTLTTECSVIAAMNPNDGNYRSDLSFKNNVKLLDSIISRFDVICIFKKDLTNDADIARFVLQSHQDNHPNAPPQEQKFTSSVFLRKYINYAKFNVHPKMGVSLMYKTWTTL
jgi:DNA replicative helicase MCM subunit Mcm2 (Cdc46/Mcm family)